MSKKCPIHNCNLGSVQKTPGYCKRCRTFWLLEGDELCASVFVYLHDRNYLRNSDPAKLRAAQEEIEGLFAPRLELEEYQCAHAILYARWYINNYKEIYESEDCRTGD